MIERRSFLLATAFGLTGTVLVSRAHGGRAAPRLIKPPRLRKGDTVGLIHSATAQFREEPLLIKKEALISMGFKVLVGPNAYRRRGYFAGTDEQRADEINQMFANAEVKMIVGRGGWGSARVLPRLDYDLIQRNPKILLGYSDVTALLLGIHAKTGLVTFHGPAPFSPYSTGFITRVLMEGEAVSMSNPQEQGENLAQRDHRIRTITSGTAKGPLLGGNLTVLSAIIGSPYLPKWDGAVLFLEDINEDIYRVDRMLTTLKLAGVLDLISGFVFGRCTRCGPGEGFGSLTLEEVLDDHIKPLGIPAFQGSMIGHIPKQFTLAQGVPVTVNAESGVIAMQEAAVN